MKRHFYHHPPKCPYCGATSKVADDTVIYGHHYGYIYLCSNWPKCDAFVGIHKGTSRPKGTLANAELREARKAAHYWFDQLWQSGKIKRKDAYQFLADVLRIPVNKCHIGMFDLKQCKNVVDIMIEFTLGLEKLVEKKKLEKLAGGW